jgi:cell division septal protein FtsQ
MPKSATRVLKKLRKLLSKLPPTALLWAAAILVTGAAVVLGSRTVWREIARQPQFRVHTLAIAPTDYPEYIDGARMTREVRRLLGRLPGSKSIFDRDLASAVQRELRRCPWVLHMNTVRREMPNSLEVGLVFRKPAGIVSMNGRQYMVDGQGHWLPDQLFKRPREWRGQCLPLIVDRMLRTPPPVGQAWDGVRLAVGARLSELFRQKGLLKKLDLAVIDVTGVGRPNEPDIVLTTADGAQIKWGTSSVYSQVGGLPRPAFLIPDAEKLAMLFSKLSDYPDLQGIKYVDLRFRGQVVFAEDN